MLCTMRRLSLAVVTSLCWLGILLLVAWHVVLQPRRLYVDENALLVNAGNLDEGSRGSSSEERQAALLLATESPELAARFDSLYNHRDADNSLCRAFRSLGTSFCDVLQIRSHAPMLQATIDAPNKPQAAESSVVVFLYSRSSPTQARAARSLALRLANDSLHVPWLAKRIVLLLLPTDCPSTLSSSADGLEPELCSPHTRHSPALAAWLRHSTHLPYDIADPADEGAELDLSSPFLGVVRDALIVDINSASAESRSQADPAPHPITLLHTGLNGNLPNMDMLAAPIAMFPSFIALPTLRPAAFLVSALAALSLLLVPAAEQLGGALGPQADRAAAHAAAAAVDAESPQWRRLRGLAEGTWRQVSGPDGLHSLFLQHNIDSVTLRVRRYLPLGALENGGVGGGGRGDGGGGSGGKGSRARGNRLPEHHLACILLSLLRTMSNLSEELHHSHFFYLPLGARHFWGLQEWAPVLALGLLPLLVLSWRLAVWRAEGAASSSTTRAVSATAAETAVAVDASASAGTTADAAASTVADGAYAGGSAGGSDGEVSAPVLLPPAPFHSHAFMCSFVDGAFFLASAAAARLLSLPPAPRGLAAALDVRAGSALYVCLLAWIWSHGMSPPPRRSTQLASSASISTTISKSTRHDARRAATAALYLSTQVGLSAALLGSLGAQAAPLALLCCGLFLPLWAAVSGLVEPSKQTDGEDKEEKRRRRPPVWLLMLVAAPFLLLASAPGLVRTCVFEWGVVGNLAGLVPLGIAHVGVAGLRVWRG